LIDFVRSLARKPTHQWRFGLLALLLVLFFCVPLMGSTVIRKLAELYHTAWTFKEEPPPEIYALAQTTDGFLWLGLQPDCVRFDGIRLSPTNRNPDGISATQRGPLDSPYRGGRGWAIGTEESAS